MNSFPSVNGYWVHRTHVASPIKEIEGTNGCVSQDVYSFIATSREEHGPKDPAMTVRCVTNYRWPNGRTEHEFNPHWRVSRTIEQGRKVYRQLIKEGYVAEGEVIKKSAN